MLIKTNAYPKGLTFNDYGGTKPSSVDIYVSCDLLISEGKKLTEFIKDCSMRGRRFDVYIDVSEPKDEDWKKRALAAEKELERVQQSIQILCLSAKVTR